MLVVDAIPWELAREAWATGQLPGFCEPVPSVSVFPSLTNVAVSALVDRILGARPPGYEARYYHPPSRAIRGGLGVPEADRPFAGYRVHPEGSLEFLASYVLPGLTAWAEVARLVGRFEREGGHWLVYAAASDGVAHFGGRETLAAVFRRLALRVVDARERIARERGAAPPVVLTSDHGMAFGRLTHVSVEEVGQALEAAGLVPESSGPDGFFLPAMGEVGAGVCYVAHDRAEMAARALARLEGVDLAIGRRDEASALVVRGAEEALIEWRGDRYRYAATSGDPLAYEALWRELGRRGAAPDGFVDGDTLLAATWAHEYPDAPHRLRRALTDLVEFPAPVLFSMRTGYTFGPLLTHVGATLLGTQVATHGSLDGRQSLGFLAVAGLPAPPPVVRIESALLPYRDLVVRGAGALTRAEPRNAPPGVRRRPS